MSDKNNETKIQNGPSKENRNGPSNQTIATKPKYKFLFVSWESLSGDLAWQIKKEGHDVKIYIKEPDDADVYEGFLERVPDWKATIDWADVIVFDDVGFGSYAENLRKKGKLVVGGSIYTDRLEEDREFGQSEMKRLGMLTLPSWNFSSYDEAINFIKNNPGRYVFKPSGLTAGDFRDFLFSGKEEDGKDLHEMLSQNKKVLEKKIKQFQLQKFVSGVEVGMSAFFNGQKFIMPILIAFEHKRLFPGELGEMTGEMGTSMFWTAPNRLFKETTEKMENNLRESGYVGYIDINCIVNGRGIYPLEYTTRFGYPTISIQMEGVLSEWGEFTYALASGQNYEFKTKKGFQVGIVCVVPPFPHDEPKTTEIYRDLSILFKKPNLEGVHLGDVKIIDGTWRVAGNSSYVLIITGSGSTMEEARRQAYSRIDNVMLINMFYRTDIGATWGEDSDKLMTWGYI